MRPQHACIAADHMHGLLVRIVIMHVAVQLLPRPWLLTAVTVRSSLAAEGHSV